MTILTVCRSLSSVIGVDRPQSVIGSTEREHQELADLAAEMCQRIAQAYPWSVLRRSLTLTAGADAYDLPDDFDYFQEGVQLRIANGCLEHEQDPDEWLRRTVEELHLSLYGAWIKSGDQILFDRETQQDVKSYYQTKNWILHDGNPAGSITADEDVFRIDERLLYLGMLWQWKANKGLPYAEDLQNFERMLAQLVMRDKGSRTFAIGRPRWDRSEQEMFYGSLGTGVVSPPVTPPVDPGTPPVDPGTPPVVPGNSAFTYTLPFALA